MSDVLPMSPLAIVLTMLGVFLGFFIATFIVILLLRGLEQRKQGAAPSLTLNAVVAGKRRGTGKASETCYVTFEAESGEREEIAVDAATYGLLSPGDAGQLTLRGAQYLGFVRN